MSNLPTRLSQSEVRRVEELKQKMINSGKDLEVLKQEPVTLMEMSEMDVGVVPVISIVGGMLSCLASETIFGLQARGYSLGLVNLSFVLVWGIFVSLFMIRELKIKNKDIAENGTVEALLNRLPPVEKIRLETISESVKENSNLKNEFYTNPVAFCQEHFGQSSNQFVLEIDEKIKADPFYLSKEINKNPKTLEFLNQKQ